MTLLGLSAACARRAEVAPLVPPSVYTLVADTAAVSPFTTPADDAARALGFPPLQRAILPARTRELRISDNSPMIAGHPVAVLRLIEQPARPPVGQVLYVWAQRRDWPTYPASRCTPWRDSFRTCVLVPTASGIDWTAVARRFEKLGAWSISAACATDGMHITDSGQLHLRRLVGATFGAYGCNAPQYRRGTEQGRAAWDLYQYFYSVVNQVAM